MSAPRPTLPRVHRAIALSALALATACGGSAPSAGRAAPAPERASDAEWRALATPRPAPLPGAARVSVGEIEINGSVPWSTPAGLEPPLALQELVAAGLLRRQDVHYVERRRFAEAAEAERLGRPRPAGAPAAGVSPGAEFVVRAVWSPVLGTGRLDVHVLDAATGSVVTTHSATVPADADAASVARTVVAGVLAALDDEGRRPAWSDPSPSAAPMTYQPAGMSASALQAFFTGLAAEERWNWEGARVAYQAAAALGGAGFVEATAALARTARLRNGGTLGGG